MARRDEQIGGDLPALGWDAGFAAEFDAVTSEGLEPARVAVQHHGVYMLLGAGAELMGEVTGRMRHEARSAADLPVVGDWVAIRARRAEGGATIVAILPRRTRFSRQAAGVRTEQQVLAANLDRVFIVSGLDGELNVRRLERYRLLAESGGAEPVFVLNKVDLCTDLAGALAATYAVAGERLVLPLSARSGEGIEALRDAIPPGTTGALLGSSGVGKSTLVNRLLGEERADTGAVREIDGKGRHVTVRRELHRIPGAGLLIDTPGMRELQLWASDGTAPPTFDEIDELAASCRFPDCTHVHEPGCAVLEGVERGSISQERLESFYKVQKELAWHRRRQDVLARDAENKRIAKLVKAFNKTVKKRR